jgi:hypothetical protein
VFVKSDDCKRVTTGTSVRCVHTIAAGHGTGGLPDVEKSADLEKLPEGLRQLVGVVKPAPRVRDRPIDHGRASDMTE